MMPSFDEVYGFFDVAGSTKPTHDPGIYVPCVVCGEALDARPIRTISFCAEGSARSWFYRLHQNCSTPEIQSQIEGNVVDGRDLLFTGRQR